MVGIGGILEAMVEYSPEIEQKILTLIATGRNLSTICDGNEFPDLPDTPTVYGWLKSRPDFASNYARARQLRAEARSDRIDGYVASMIAGKIMSDVARVAIDTEKWQAGKENSKYSEKTSLEQAVGILDIIQAMNKLEALEAPVIDNAPLPGHNPL